MNFGDLEIIDDNKDELEHIRDIVKNNDQEDAFYVLDLANVINKHKIWKSIIPRVDPHFAIKCNPDKTVVRTLAALNAGFDCASKHEIEHALACGVSSDRIIFANTVKPESHIKFARKVGVDLLTVDSEFELSKIRSIFPEAKIVIRFVCDASSARVYLGSKFGCDPITQAPKIIKMAKDLGMNLHGFSFHVGAQCREIPAWIRGIKIAKDLIHRAKSMGHGHVKLIDIGGGFPAEKDLPICEIAEAINEALRDLDPEIRVISEPGRFYVVSAFTLATLVFSKRIITERNRDDIKFGYYINDGTFGSFISVMLKRERETPIPLNKPANEKTYNSQIWGPTCDSIDCVVPECDIPELNIGDWLVWQNMGAYTICHAGNFNGIPPTVVKPFIRRKEWNSFLQECDSRIIPFNNNKK